MLSFRDFFRNSCSFLRQISLNQFVGNFPDKLADGIIDRIAAHHTKRCRRKCQIILGSGHAHIGKPSLLFHFFLTDDGLTTVQDGSIAIRPYAYYPNPAQDQLRLQYSPDVQPKQVELYDLQGRLVRSQSQGLESVDLQGLASGQYLMKVTLEDGKSFTDKVVKE